MLSRLRGGGGGSDRNVIAHFLLPLEKNEIKRKTIGYVSGVINLEILLVLIIYWYSRSHRRGTKV